MYDERNHLEEKLKLLEFCVDNIGEAVYWLTMDLRFWNVNAAACSMLGYSRDELLSLSVHDIDLDYSPESGQSDLELLKRAGTLSLRRSHTARDGRIIPVEITINYFIYNNVEYICCIVRDITERNLAEEARKASEAMKALILNSTMDYVIYHDPDMKIVWANRNAGKLVNLPVEALIGRHCWEVAFKRDIPCEDCPVILARDTGEPQKIEKHHTNGLTLIMRAYPIKNDQGRLLGIAEFVSDITERKRVEEELQQALEAANSVNNTMRRLLRTVAHEFRTPLGLLTGCVDVLDRYWDRLTPEKRIEQNEHIRNAARQISNLVNSVTSFNQTGTDRAGKPRQLQDIGNLCRSIAAEVETVWCAGHEFIVSLAADCGTVLIDDILFRRILQNLLTNACRYTPTNGTVSLHVYREKEMLLLEITDTGIGIPEEDQALIFDPFYRSRNIEGRRGLGLGLSIVRDALSQMGGTITVTSSIGKGTAVRVKIPVIEPR